MGVGVAATRAAGRAAHTSEASLCAVSSLSPVPFRARRKERAPGSASAPPRAPPREPITSSGCLPVHHQATHFARCRPRSPPTAPASIQLQWPHPAAVPPRAARPAPHWGWGRPRCCSPLGGRAPPSGLRPKLPTPPPTARATGGSSGRSRRRGGCSFTRLVSGGERSVRQGGQLPRASEGAGRGREAEASRCFFSRVPAHPCSSPSLPTQASSSASKSWAWTSELCVCVRGRGAPTASGGEGFFAKHTPPASRGARPVGRYGEKKTNPPPPPPQGRLRHRHVGWRVRGLLPVLRLQQTARSSAR